MNPSCIDHILTNIPSHFMKSCALETGISDYHKMIMTIFRVIFAKGKSKTYVYRCYKNFDKQRFEESLSAELGENNLTFDKFFDIFINTLDRYAPIKKKKLRHNIQPFMSKTLRKAVMTRSRLRNKFNLNRNPTHWKKYKQQCNFCVKLLRQKQERLFQQY